MKVPKHMTGRQRGYQQLFRIVFGSLPSKGWVGGPVQDRLPIHLDGMASFISPVCAGSEACISGPFNANLVFLPTRHAVAVIVVYKTLRFLQRLLPFRDRCRDKPHVLN